MIVKTGTTPTACVRNFQQLDGNITEILLLCSDWLKRRPETRASGQSAQTSWSG